MERFTFLFDFFQLLFCFLKLLSELRSHRNLGNSFILFFDNFKDGFFLFLKILKLGLKYFNFSLLTGYMLIIVNVFQLSFLISDCILNLGNSYYLLGNKGLFEFDLFWLLFVINVNSILFLFGVTEETL